jgi:hypothetical protein
MYVFSTHRSALLLTPQNPSRPRGDDMRPSLIFIAVVVAFGTGIAGSEFIRATSRMFVGEEEVRCIEARVCVGSPSPETFSSLDTDKFGLANFYCLDGVKRYDEFIFMADIISGKRCPTKNYVIEFHNATTRTLVEIRNGKIAKITKGPLYSIDL